MERDLREALYAINRCIGHWDTNTPTADKAINTLQEARDQVWDLGRELYGWEF